MSFRRTMLVAIAVLRLCLVPLRLAGMVSAEDDGPGLIAKEAGDAARRALIRENHPRNWIVDRAAFLPVEATLYDQSRTLRWRPIPRVCLEIPGVPPLLSFGLFLSAHGINCPPPPIWVVYLHDGDLDALSVVNALHGHSDTWAWVTGRG